MTLIIGIILIAIAVFLFFRKKKLENKLLNIKYFDKVDIKSAVENCISVSKELGTGYYSQMVKIVAKSGMDEPIQGEFSNRECVYYEVSAEHRFERKQETRDQNGRVRTNWVSGTSTIGSARVGGEFWLEDNSGARLNIDIEGADMTLINAVNDFKSTKRSTDFSFGSYNAESSRNMRSKGYSISESNIPVGRQLFVIGELHDRDGIPKISKPQDDEADNPFIVSTVSEDKVIGKIEGKTKMMIFGAIACIIGGIILIGMGLFK